MLKQYHGIIIKVKLKHAFKLLEPNQIFLPGEVTHGHDLSPSAPLGAPLVCVRDHDSSGAWTRAVSSGHARPEQR